VTDKTINTGYDNLIKFLATVGGVGNIPWASGTFGTLPPLALATLVGWRNPEFALLLFPLLALLTTVIGIPVATRAEKIYQKKDSGRIVIDEVAGYFWTIAAIPLWVTPQSFAIVLIGGFFLFRLFDIWKPFPIRNLQNLPGGWGVVIDDVLAGIYANIVLRIILYCC